MSCRLGIMESELQSKNSSACGNFPTPPSVTKLVQSGSRIELWQAGIFGEVWNRAIRRARNPRTNDHFGFSQSEVNRLPRAYKGERAIGCFNRSISLEFTYGLCRNSLPQLGERVTFDLTDAFLGVTHPLTDFLESDWRLTI